MTVKLRNYLNEMLEFRIGGRGVDKIRDSLMEEIKNKHLTEKLHDQYFYIARFKNPRVKDLIDISRFLKRENLLDDVYREAKTFIQPKSNLSVKVIKVLDNDFAYLLGVIAGDGHITKTGYQIVIVCGKEGKEYINLICELIRKSFGKKPYLVNFKRGKAIFIQSKIIHHFLTKIIGLPAGKKHSLYIPRLILKDSGLMKHFIAGFFDTDGSIFTKKGKRTPYIKIAQKSRTILEEIGEFLSGFDIKYVFEQQKRTKVNYLIIYRKSSVFKFCRLIKSKHPSKLEKMNRFALSYKTPP